MSGHELDERIGEAWRAHYEGNQQVAIDKFLAILKEAPDHIDANWGLGLSYRKAGQRDKALEVFKQVREMVSGKLDAQLEANAQAEDYERMFMLKRMVNQQIDQMGQFIR